MQNDISTTAFRNTHIKEILQSEYIEVVTVNLMLFFIF